MKSKYKARALVMYSGGLDSRLAAKLLEKQGIKVIKVLFKFPFVKDIVVKEKKMHIIDCTKGRPFNKYLSIIRNPKHGRGAGINPCIDCRIFILKHAEKLLKKFNCRFIATGEVLGQRPMSQTSRALKIIDSAVKGIKRPLIGHGIKGRSRKQQIALAKKYRISYPNPAGGCLLCEKEFAKKLADLFRYQEIIKPAHVETIKIGRHFRSPRGKGKIILGRDEKENLALEKLSKKLNFHIIIPIKPGPIALYEKKSDKKLAKQLISAYSGSNPKKRKSLEKFRI